MSVDFIRVPLDSSGKRTAARTVTIPAGSVILDADGVESTLASDTTVFVQQTVASAVVSDTPEAYTPAQIQALSMTIDGRLRVSAVTADITKIWQNTFADGGWTDDTPSAAQSDFPFAGAQRNV